MRIDDSLDEREAETVAFDLPVHRVGASVERLEDVRELRRRNSGPVIADRDPHDRLAPIAILRRAYADPAIGPAILEGVGDEILNRRSQRRGITNDRRQRRCDVAFDHDAGACNRHRTLDRRLDDLLDVERRARGDRATRFDAGVLQHAFHHLTQAARFGFEQLSVALHAIATADDSVRQGLYQQIRQIVFDDAPIIYAHYETINYLMNTDVTGSSVNPTLELRMENVGFTG